MNGRNGLVPGRGLLFDRVRHGPVAALVDLKQHLRAGEFDALMDAAQVFDVTEVDHWLDVTHEERRTAGRGHEDWADVEYAPPPYKHVWLEFPAESVGDSPERLAWTQHGRRGLLVNVWESGEIPMLPALTASIDLLRIRWMYEVLLVCWNDERTLQLQEQRDGTWKEMTVVRETPPIIKSAFLMAVDERGRMLPKHNAPHFLAYEGTEPGSPYSAYLITNVFALLACPPSNVPRTLHRPLRQASRLHQRETGKPLVSYWTLDVGPSEADRMRAANLRMRAAREGRASPRLHWVRGHFKRGQFVTDGKPHGRYCRPHLRGTMDEGAIVKGYAVHTPHGGN